MKTNRGFSGLIILLVIAVIAGGIFWYVQQNKMVGTKSIETATSTSPQTNASDKFASWNTYTSPTSILTFKYPDGWEIVKETQSMPPVIAVSPEGYDNPRNFGAFQVFKVVDDGSSGGDSGPYDTGWGQGGNEVTRLVTTKDGKYRIVMAGETSELKAANEEILSTFEYKP